MLNIDDRLIKEVGPKIGANALAVLLAIAIHLNNKTDRCFPSHRRLMALTGCGRDAVYTALEKLKDAGLLKTIQAIDSKSGKFGRREFKVSTKFISIFVTADEAEPLTENPYTVQPYTDNPDTDNQETYLINEVEPINNLEPINKFEHPPAKKDEITPLNAEKKDTPQIPAAPPANTPISAAITAADWCKQNPDQLKSWIEMSRFKGGDIEPVILGFFSYYMRDAGPYHKVNTDSLSFFRNGFPGWLINQAHMKAGKSITNQQNNGNNKQSTKTTRANGYNDALNRQAIEELLFERHGVRVGDGEPKP